MSDQVELTDPVDHSVGGMYGHLFRRAFHIGMSFIPLVYYEYADDLSDLASITELQLVSLLTFGIAFSEAVRLKLGITIFGQRDYESKQVSALAWGGLAVGLTFLTLSEYPELVWPLILSLSLGDPFLGEVRRKGNTSKNGVYLWLNIPRNHLDCVLVSTRYSNLDGCVHGSIVRCSRMAEAQVDRR